MVATMDAQESGDHRIALWELCFPDQDFQRSNRTGDMRLFSGALQRPSEDGNQHDAGIDRCQHGEGDVMASFAVEFDAGHILISHRLLPWKS